MNLQSPPSDATGAAFDPKARHPLLQAFLDTGRTDVAAIEAFVQAIESPLVEPGAVTFLWHGEADRVELLRWIHSGVDRDAFWQTSGSSLWTLRLAVEDGGRFEYKIGVCRHRQESWILDPLNPDRAGDPFGENSVCRTHGYARPAWSLPQGAPAGTIEAFNVHSGAFGETREEKVFLPAGYDPQGSHPLVVIHDGDDFMSYADLTVSLDNLIAAGDIPPVVAVLIQTGDRMGEYPGGRRHARYLVDELLPAVEARYAVTGDASQRVLLGASLGAVASLATAFRCPGVFGGLVLKSGSFILDPARLSGREHPVFHRIARLVRALQRAPGLRQTRAYVSTGELEGLAEENRALAEHLRESGVDVLFQSSWDGHHWHNWRDQLRDGLMWVLRREDA